MRLQFCVTVEIDPAWLAKNETDAGSLLNLQTLMTQLQHRLGDSVKWVHGVAESRVSLAHITTRPQG